MAAKEAPCPRLFFQRTPPPPPLQHLCFPSPILSLLMLNFESSNSARPPPSGSNLPLVPTGLSPLSPPGWFFVCLLVSFPGPVFLPVCSPALFSLCLSVSPNLQPSVSRTPPALPLPPPSSPLSVSHYLLALFSPSGIESSNLLCSGGLAHENPFSLGTPM